MTDELRLVAYDGSCATEVVGWCADSPYSSGWVPAGATNPDGVLSGWLNQADITGHLLLRGDTPVAYGELWLEADDDEAELAHLVVDPGLRRQGLGRALASELVSQALSMGLSNVFLRVQPDNTVAIGSYSGLGFVPVSAEEEASFNEGQPAAYHWMRFVQDTVAEPLT